MGLQFTLSDWGGFRKELAAELSRKGLLKSYITTNPPWKTKDLGIPADRIRHRSNFRYVEHLAGKVLPSGSRILETLKRAKDRDFGHFVARVADQDSHLCFLSGSGLPSLQKRRAQRGGKSLTFLQRGSSQIRWLEDVLDAEYAKLNLSRKRLDDFYIDKEEQEYQHCDKIVVPSESAKRSFVQCGIPADKIAVIPLGVNDRAAAGPAHTKKSGEVRKKLIFVGQISVRKGVHILSDALKALNCDWEMTFVGSRADGLDLEFLDSSPRVKFLGNLPRPEVSQKMAEADVLILPSIEDGFGRVVIECTAAGTPVIVSDQCGAAEVIHANGGGWVYDAFSTDELRGLISRTLGDDEFYEAALKELRRPAAMRSWSDYADDFVAMAHEMEASPASCLV